MPGQIQIPIELLEQFERGNVLLFVGEGINQGILPSAAAMAQELADRCGYPSEEPLTLPRVAGYYELTRNDRHGLVQFLRDRLEKPGLALPRAHELAAHLRPPVIITTCYDRLLERALREASVPYVQVVGNTEVAYAEEKKVLLVWLWGVLDQPDSIIVTEDDRRMFLEGRSNLSDVLRGELARRTWLFIGFDAEDEWFRGFYDGVNRGLDRQSRRAYIFGAVPGAYTRAWWEKHNAEILSADVETFLDVLNEQLVARAQPESARRMVAVTTESLPLPEEPYKALVSYEAQDRALFFGRDREIEELAALMHAQRLVLLYGASGVGKTSLLQAGAIPRLEAATPGYTVINVRALTDPADAIRATLRRKLPDAKLGSDDAPLINFLDAAFRASDRHLILVIDQFEEFFIRLSPEFRTAFIAELGAIYDARDLPVKVVLSLREDYLARISEIENRIPEIFRTKMRLLPLTREQAREAIVRPVEALGYAYAPDLVARLLDDLTREGVMPPQLQLVCSALFHHARREGRKTLTLADYEALGGAQGVLRGYLDEELHRLPTDEQTLARDMLEELVTSEGTKKVATLAELAVALASEPEKLSKVTEKLVQARLLRLVEWADTTEPVYELAHEYLIHEIGLTGEAQARKQAEEMIAQELDNYRRFGTLFPPDKLVLLDEVRQALRLSPETQEFLLRSALQHDMGVPYWLTRLEDPTQRLEVLTETVASPRADLRSKAATALGMLDHVTCVEPLIALATRDQDPHVRAVAYTSLVALNNQQSLVVTQLIAISTGSRRESVAYALEALSALPFKGLSIGLRARILGNHLWLRARAVGRWVRDDPIKRFLVRTVGLLVMLLTVIYAFAASRYYVDVGETSGYDDRSVVIRRGHPDLRLPAMNNAVIDTGLYLSYFTPDGKALILSQQMQGFWWQKTALGDPKWMQDSIGMTSPHPMARTYWHWGQRSKASELLIQWLDTDVWYYAVTALQQIMSASSQKAPPQTLEALVGVLADDDEIKRSWAAGALEQILSVNPEIATVQTVEGLVLALEDDDLEVRSSAVTALGQIISANPEIVTVQVVEALMKALTDVDPGTRSIAAGTLAQIASANPEVVTMQVVEALVGVLVDDYQYDYQYDYWYARSHAAGALGQIVGVNPEMTSVLVLNVLTRVVPANNGNMYRGAAQALGEIVIAHPETATTLVNALVGLLTGDDPNVRSSAAVTLGQILSATPITMTESVTEALARALTDNTATVRASAAEALGQVASTNTEIATTQIVELLMEILADDEPNVRSRVVWALRQIVSTNPNNANPSMVEALILALADDDSNVRSSGVAALGQIVSANPEIAPESVVEALVRAATDDDSNVRSSGVAALEQIVSINPEMAGVQMVEALVRALTDDALYIRPGAARALGQIASTNPKKITRQTLETLVEMLGNDDADARYRAAGALGQIASNNPDIVTTAMVEALVKALEDENWDMRSQAAWALGQVTSTKPEIVTMSVVEALVETLMVESANVRNNAAKALVQIVADNPKVTTTLVIKALTKVAARYYYKDVFGEEALGQIISANVELMDASVVEALVEALEDDDIDIRYGAARALGQIASVNHKVVTSQTTEALIAVLADSDWYVRSSATRALGQIASANPEMVTSHMVEALIVMSADYVGSVRSSAVWALGQITSANPEMVSGQMVEALVRVMKDDEWDDSSFSAAKVLGQTASPNAEMAIAQMVEVLVGMLEDDDPDMRRRAVETLGQVLDANPKMLTAQMVEALTRVLADDDLSVRASAVYAFGQIVSANPDIITTQTIEALVRTSVQYNETWREVCDHRLLQPNEIEVLVTILTDRLNAQARNAAAHVLFYVALYDQESARIVCDRLEELTTRHEPISQMWANMTLEMINLADLAQTAATDPSQFQPVIYKLARLQGTWFFGEDFAWAAGEALYWLQQQQMAEGQDNW